MLKDMFHDLELADDCDEVIDKFPSVVDKLKTNAYKAETNKIKMGTKSLGKGKNSKVHSNTTASQSNCSSIQPLHPLGRMGRSQIWKNRYQNWWISVTMKLAVLKIIIGVMVRGPPLKRKMKRIKMKIPDIPTDP